MSKLLKLDSKKINIIATSQMVAVDFTKIIKALPYKHIVGVKSREELILTLNKISVAHINDGVAIICHKNYNVKTIDCKVKSYINKITLFQSKFFNGQWDRNIRVTNGNYRKVYELDEILEDLKIHSRYFKIIKLKDNIVKKATIYYNIKIDDREEQHSFTLSEKDIEMSWGDFEKLSDKYKGIIINEHYMKELDKKITHSIIGINFNK